MPISNEVMFYGQIPLIQAQDIVYKYGSKLILNHISINLEKGGIYILRGPSGSGKSSLLRIIAGDMLPSSGTLLYHSHDKSISTSHPEFELFYRKNIGTFFTESLFFEKNTVRENIYFPSLFGKYYFDFDFFEELVERLEIASLLDTVMREVSSGERERIDLVRMLVSRPSILFLDEPLSHLDERLFHIGMDLLRDYVIQVAPTIFVISHNPDLTFDGAHHLSLQNSILTHISC